MELRAQSIVFWPGMSYDIKMIRSSCEVCNKNAPSQARLPPEPSNPPMTPFEQVFSDFFQFGGHHYLIIGDRLSGWSEVYCTPPGSQYAGARGLIRCLRTFFTTFGVPEELASDGGPEFTADSTKKFLEQWDVRHRISSAYFPQSNGRAEVAVKSAKRLLRSNIGPTGTLCNDRFLRAMLQLRNTPDPDCNLSPAEIVFGRRLKDTFSFTNHLKKPDNSMVRQSWKDVWGQKELALRKRFTRWHESLKEHSKALPPLNAGDACFVQNQHGAHSKRWDRSGTIVEVLPHHQYMVKIDGSGRLTRRNRRFLRRFEPASTEINCPPPYDVGRSLGDRAVTPIHPHVHLPVQHDRPAGHMQPSHPDVHLPVQRERPVSDMQLSNDESTAAQEGHSRPERTRLPLMQRRLQPHNKPGLLETPLPGNTSALYSR